MVGGVVFVLGFLRFSVYFGFSLLGVFGGFGRFFGGGKLVGQWRELDAGLQRGDNFCANALSHGAGDLINVGIKRSCETCCGQHYIDPFLAWSITEYKREWQLPGTPSAGLCPCRGFKVPPSGNCHCGEATAVTFRRDYTAGGNVPVDPSPMLRHSCMQGYFPY